MNRERIAHIPAFSITDGGPGTALMKRLRLVRPELEAGSPRTALALAILTWVPLFVLCRAQGFAFGRVRMPFIHDIFAHVRFLVTVPILVLAEIPIGPRLRAVVRHFVEAPLVSDEDLPRFEAIVIDCLHLRDSRVAELGILGLSYLLTYTALSGISLLGDSTWFRPGSGASLTLVGYWYAFVSLPIYQFLILRWIYRIGVYAWFLRKVSKLRLMLTPIDPDGAGGLAFIAKGMIPFGLILFGLSAAISGAIASRILFEGAGLDEFQWTYVALMVIGILIIEAPMLVFVPNLLRLKQQGLMDYATVGTRYSQSFQRGSIEQALSSQDPLPDLTEIQTLDSFSNRYEKINSLKVVPIEVRDLIAIALPAVIPGLPLLVTIMPLEAILTGLLKMVV